MKSAHPERDVMVEVTIICSELRSEKCGSKSIHITDDVELVKKNAVRLFLSLRSRFYELLRQMAFRTPLGWILLEGIINPEDEAKLSIVIQKLESVKKAISPKSRKKVDFPRAVYRVEALLPACLVYEWLEANIENARRKIKELKSRHRIRRWSDILRRLEQYKSRLLRHISAVKP